MNEFLIYALITGGILALLFGVFSFFAVTRKMTFLGVGIAHTAFGGAALAVLLSWNPFWTTFGFCLLTAILIGKTVRAGKMSYDSGIGIFFSFTMALGSVFLALNKGYNFDLQAMLFGSVLGIQPGDMINAGIVLVLFLIFTVLFLKRIVFMSFDRDVAETSGIRTGILDTVLLVFLAAITVVGLKLAGIILVSALVVLPASFGLLLSDNYRGVIGWGIVYSLVVFMAGLGLSAVVDIPPGALMVTFGTVIYFFSLGIKRILVR